KGRTLAFAGETWVWARASEESQLAHRKFWRQAIFWLLHKEDQGDNSVKLSLDRRRIAFGEKIELTVAVRDAKGEPIPDAKFVTTVTRIGPDVASDDKPEPVDLYYQGEDARGTYFATEKAKARADKGQGRGAPPRQGTRPRLGPLPHLSGRSRAGEPGRRPRPPPPDRRRDRGQVPHPRGPLQAPRDAQGPGGRGLLQPDRA